MNLTALLSAILLSTACTLFSCKGDNARATNFRKKESLEEKSQRSLDSIHSSAQEGDLIVRLGDDLLSEQIRYLSEKDQSFSHAGIIVEKEGKKWVYHIAPDDIGADTVRFEPIDSFVNPKKNILCGIYRYDLSAVEKASFINKLLQYHASKAVFDRTYNLETDDKIYCSEMIAKSIKIATNNRIDFKEAVLPKKLLPFMYAYFKNENASKKEIAERKYISIDNLYLMPECTQVLKLPVKYFP